MSDTPPLHPREARFYELDILRGLAAIVVVLFHYKHFLLISEAQGFDYAHMPFISLLMPFYQYGQFFVELFFAISGYVFFWLYAEPIRSRHTDATRFFIARFARLYPLYFVTLMAVVLLQAVFNRLYGADFIYHDNTPVNFILNLFMVQQWWPNATQTFNGPAWSISVEVFLYTLFFALCYFRRTSLLTLVTLCVGGLLYERLNGFEVNDFARGMPHFFLGGIIYRAVQSLRAHEQRRRQVVWGLAVLLPVLCMLSYIRGRAVMPVVPARDFVSMVFSIESFTYLILPLFLLGVGLMQGHWRTHWLSRENLHRWSWVGDISYSIYLIHFPLQLSIMLVLAHWPFAERIGVLSSPFALLGFMAAACGLGWLSHRYFEMPMQRFLRRWLTERLVQPKPAR